MIHGSVKALQDDFKVLIDWAKGEEIPEVTADDRAHRVQIAATRMIALTAMAFGSLWTLSILTFVITLPLTITFKLITAVALVVIGHDILRMSHNALHSNFRKDNQDTNFFGFLRGLGVTEEERALAFTHGTLLQAGWMWLYVKQKVAEKLTLPVSTQS